MGYGKDRLNIDTWVRSAQPQVNPMSELVRQEECVGQPQADSVRYTGERTWGHTGHASLKPLCPHHPWCPGCLAPAAAERKEVQGRSFVPRPAASSQHSGKPSAEPRGSRPECISQHPRDLTTHTALSCSLSRHPTTVLSIPLRFSRVGDGKITEKEIGGEQFQ